MEKYRVLKPVYLHSGLIGLTAEQARPRAGCLAPAGDGEYEIKSQVCFKAGEVVALDGLEKVHAADFECIEDVPAEVAEVEPVEELAPVAEAKPVVKKTRSKRAK